jgi:hypothetical protein
MSIIKRDNKTTQSLGTTPGKPSNFRVIQEGQITLPFIQVNLGSTNVAVLSKVRIAHNYPCLSENTLEYFEKPPVLFAQNLSTIIGYSSAAAYGYSGWGEKITVIYDGTNWVETIQYSFITTRYIYMCSLTIRHSGTLNGYYWGGDTVYYYLVSPTGDSSDSGAMGGGATPESTVLTYQCDDYDLNNVLVGSSSGTIYTSSLLPYRQLDFNKYSNALHGQTGG